MTDNDDREVLEECDDDDEEKDDGHQLQDLQVAGGEGLAGKQPAEETLASLYSLLLKVHFGS